MSEKSAPIGSLNGPWAATFKIILAAEAALLPFIVGWCIWVTRSQYDTRQSVALLTQQMEQFIDAGPRYTPSMAERDGLKLERRIMDAVGENFVRINP